MRRARAPQKLERIFLLGCVIFGCISLNLFLNHQEHVVAINTIDRRSKVSFPPPPRDTRRESLGKSQSATSHIGSRNETKTSNHDLANTTHLNGPKSQSATSHIGPRNETKTTNHDLANATHLNGPKVSVRKKPRFTIEHARRTSSVDYSTCCGVGHRLSKLADVNYLAKTLKSGLRVFFGFCDKQEVYSYLFGPQPLDELEEVVADSSGELFLRVKNDAPGFSRLRREGPNATCKCPEDRLVEDFKFYNSLRARFRARPKVEAFRQAYFTNHTVIGMHVRAGNNETGDFTNKNRSITDSKWAESMAGQLLVLSSNWIEPPLLFIATDTSSMITTFRSLLEGKMQVVELSQKRPEQGQGVFFGASLHVLNEGEACLDGWESAFADMMILSHADVVVAARPSSFTQSLPMTMALSTPKANRKVLESFCEVNHLATAVRCYEDLIDWCCKGNTSFSLHTIHNYDYRRMPDMDILNTKKFMNQMDARPRDIRECIPTPKNPQRNCLPYDMPDKDHVEEAGRTVGLPPKQKRKPVEKRNKHS